MELFLPVKFYLLKRFILILFLLIAIEARPQYIPVVDTLITKDSVIAGKEYWIIRSQFQTHIFPGSEGVVMNGKREGEWRSYGHTTNLESVSEYKNGMKNGPYKEYYDY